MAALSRLLLIVLRDGSIDRHHQQDMVREWRECKSGCDGSTKATTARF
jgi:hypothetical protein